MAAIRSSIRLRSTSQYFSDERSRLWIGSTEAVSSSSVVERRNDLQFLLDVSDPCWDFDILERVRLGRPPAINDPPPSSVLPYSQFV
jgi:hypothetical protein